MKTIDSKYLCAFLEKEEQRIRNEITDHTFRVFQSKGFVISISCDSANSTERIVKDMPEFRKAFWIKDRGPYRWMFLYPKGTKRAAAAKPLGWVHFNIDNAADIVTDYHIDVASVMTPVNDNAKRFW